MSDTITTTTSTVPWAPITPYVEGSYGRMDTLAQDTPQYFPGQTYVDFTQPQVAGQQQVLDYAGGLQPTINNSMGALNWGMNAVMDPNSNQALQSYIASAQRPLTQAYNEQVLPAIRDRAEMYGGAGNRTGIAEGIASRSYMDAMGDVSSGMTSQAYGQGLNQQARMMALLPQTMTAGTMPGQFMQGVGGVQQTQNQMGVTEDVNRWNYGENIGYQREKDYLSMLQGTPWGTSTTVGPDPNASPGGASGAIGGMMAGAGLGNMMSAGTWLGAGPGMMMGPAGWAGLAAGGLIGAFS